MFRTIEQVKAIARTVHSKAVEKGITRKHVLVGALGLFVVVNAATSEYNKPVSVLPRTEEPVQKAPAPLIDPSKATKDKDRLTDYYRVDECNAAIEQAFEMEPGALVYDRKEMIDGQEFMVWREVWRGSDLKGYTDYMCGLYRDDLLLMRGVYPRHEKPVYMKWYNMNMPDFGPPQEYKMDVCTRQGCY